MKPAIYRQHMQSRDKYVKWIKNKWRSDMRSKDGQEVPTKDRKAIRRRFSLR